MVESTCCFSGHRTLPQKAIAGIEKRVSAELDTLIQMGVNTFISGGALGFDQLAAHQVLKVKEKKPHIRLIMALPCKNQDEMWTEKQSIEYNDLISRADQVVYTGENYNKFSMYIRNQYMIDNAAYLVCYYNHGKGGTFQTVKMAVKKDIYIINLALGIEF